jgi:thiamine-phosphate pyrophosphorylase
MDRLNLPDSGLPDTILMTDEKRLADPLAVIGALPANSAVILRHYGVPEREELALRLITAARKLGVRVLIAADARLAVKVGADGLHLPEALAARGPGIWRTWCRPDWLVTASAHSPGALCRAGRCGADAALLAPVFPTDSHPQRAPIGCLRFSAWCRQSPVPVYALGGVKPENQRRLKGSGAWGIAGISGFLDTP